MSKARGVKRKTTEQQLSNYIIDQNGCWIWQGHKMNTGYGQININNKRQLAHRVSYEYYKGAISNYCVCHTCDVRACINPDHLWIGSLSDNSKDAFKKNRNRIDLTSNLRGERHPLSKLTEEQIIEIRNDKLTKPYLTHRDLATKYGVGKTLIANILHRRTWKHV